MTEGRSFDLSFVDGNHRFDGAFLDLVYLGRLVHGGGVVFVDDYQPAVGCPGSLVLHEQHSLGGRRAVDRRELHHWIVLRTPHVLPERVYDHYVPF